MQRSLLNRWRLLCCVVLLGLVGASSSHGQPAAPDDPLAPAAAAEASSTAMPVEAAQRFTRFVPLTANGAVPTGGSSTVFGVEMVLARPDHGLDFVAQLGPAWVRRNALLWKDVEPIDGRGYKWTSPNVTALEAELRAMSERGLQPILIVRGSPRWAISPYIGDCAPVNPAKYAQYAAFLAAAVDRYSRPPFNVHVWELGNEPDVPLGGDNIYGCWGIASDPYYGGRAYGDLLKAVYPAMKAANPAVQVMNGSVLMEAPGNPALKFMEGVLVAGAGNAFDILGYHSYCMFDPKNPDGHDIQFKSCADDWKITFLRSLTRQYGIPNKPLFRTEAALICSVPHQACRQQQAEFIARHYARTARDGLLGAIWYAFDSDSFQYSGLIEPTNPALARPAYWAMKHAAAMFGTARYRGPLAGQPAGVEGYVFERDGALVTIVWSNKPQTTSIPVAAGAAVTCSGSYGQAVACANVAGAVPLTVGPSPSYVVGR